MLPDIKEAIVPARDDFFQYNPNTYGKNAPAARNVKENISRVIRLPVLIMAIL